MGDYLFEHDPDDTDWQCDCAPDVYNPEDYMYCFNCHKPKPTKKEQHDTN